MQEIGLQFLQVIKPTFDNKFSNTFIPKLLNLFFHFSHTIFTYKTFLSEKFSLLTHIMFKLSSDVISINLISLSFAKFSRSICSCSISVVRSDLCSSFFNTTRILILLVLLKIFSKRCLSFLIKRKGTLDFFFSVIKSNLRTCKINSLYLLTLQYNLT